MQGAAAFLLLCAAISSVWLQASSENVLVPAVTKWLSEAIQVRRINTNLSLARDCPTPVQFIRDGRRYCQTSCVSSSMCGPVRIPEDHLQPCSSCNSSGLNCVTGRGQGSGVNNSDFILYVSGLDDQCSGQYSGQIVYGGYCQQEFLYDRPIAGFLNFCPAILTDRSSFDHNIGIVFHELVHTLVFSKQLFSYYRDEQGLPRTQRSWDGKPLIRNNNYIISTSTLNYVTDPASGASSGVVGMIVTPKVVKTVVEHFNCSSLIGAQLENQGVEPHWEKSLFGNEVMTGSLYEYFVISRVTLALFEDSGWYRVDYQYAQSLDWGRGRGCDFVNSNCRGWLQYAPSRDLYPFCTDSDWHGNHHRCVNSWKAVGDCSIKNYTNPLPTRYRVLPPNLGGTESLADFCPVYQADNKVGKSCKVQPNTQTSNLGLEVYGPQSLCVTLSKPWTSVNSQRTMATQTDWGAGCYQVTCNPSQVIVTIGNQVVPCVPGMIRNITVTSGGITRKGGVVCPAYKDVCAGFNCYKRCSDNGQCSNNGYCLCNPGYFGDDCSRRYIEGLQSCSNVTCRYGAQCQDTPLGARCVCLPGFTGTLCDVVTATDPCALQPCGGRGLCSRTNGGQNAECRCYRGYSGTYCQSIVDYCTGVGMYCGRGQCANDSMTPHCVCPPGYTGPSCEQVIDRCVAMEPCRNGGLCINTNTSALFQCRCPIGFKGKICKQLDVPCPPDVCPGGSRCYVAGGNHSVCACMEPSCGLTWAEVCPPSTCQNGGVCVWNGLTNQCLCPPGTAGVSCTLSTTTIPSFLGNGYLVVPMATDNSTNYTVTISVKPDGPDGWIFYWEGPSSSLLLRLQGLSLVYQIGNTDVPGGGVMVEVTDTGSLDLGKWYSITMQWSTISCALYVTNGSTTRYIPCPKTTPLTLGSYAFIGGHSNITATPTSGESGFVGCVSHLEVNGSPVNMTPGGAGLVTPEGVGQNVFQCGVAGPCGECGGVCRSGAAEGYWCECGASEGGALCDEVLHSSAVAFNHSYLLLPLNSSLNNITITITLTSHITSGLLLLLTATPTASGSYLAVTLNNSNITVETYLVSGESWTVTLPLTVAMETRQDIVMVFRNRMLKNINKSRVVGGASYVLGNSQLIYVGGVSPWQPQSKWKWWSGCVLKVKVNGQDVSMETAIGSTNIKQCT